MIYLSTNETKAVLEHDSKGKPLCIIENFVTIMQNDKHYQSVYLNEHSGQREIHSNGRVTIWTDDDDALSRHYIESKFGLYSRQKHDDALRILFNSRRYNPLTDLVETFKWDHQNRCEHFLTKWGKAEDSAYTREISRLLFAEGIHRLYEPGCKSDGVLVLVGDQGAGKSQLVQLLALNDAYFTTTKNMSGDQKSIEQLQGAWIVEIPELAAFKGADIESLKAFVTQTVDRYRKPWDKNISVLPRRCVFVGTTNNHQFLSDMTGNRRFFPVDIHSSGYEIHDRKDEIMDYISQCWAEAKERYDSGDMAPVANPALLAEYQEKQENAMEDDWRVGVIEDYLNRKAVGDLVCVKELYDNALYTDSYRQPSRKESVEIGLILDKLPNWKRKPKVTKTKNYGAQRCWECLSSEYDDELRAVFSG